MILSQIRSNKSAGRKSLAVLVDPDKVDHPDQLFDISRDAADYGVDYFFVGGSLISNEMLSPTVKMLKTSGIPVILFPGHYSHVVPEADAILLLSLISGRNSDYLIGQHVQAARGLKKAGIEVMPTSYMLVGSAVDSSVAYVSNTQPIPFEKKEIAISTALAGELLGHKLIFLDAGSGATRSVSEEMLSDIAAETNLPMIVGGGIRSADQLKAKFLAGADIAVVGNILESDKTILKDLCDMRNRINSGLNVH